MQQNAPIYWTYFTYEAWKLIIAATEQGLCFTGSQGADFQELQDWANRRYPGCDLIQDEERLNDYATELKAYLQGKATQFSFSTDTRGTPFQQEVWAALCDIPYGQTASYSDIALKIQRPGSARAVGAAIGANPVLITIPCHRVVGKNGTLTGYRGGLPMKTQLLELEGNNNG